MYNLLISAAMVSSYASNQKLGFFNEGGEDSYCG